MSSFRSHHYPKSSNYLAHLQEHALRFYAFLAMVFLLASVIMINAGKDVFWFGIIGSIVGLFLANLGADASLHRKIAEIHFVNDTFAVISVHDILTQKHAKTFPLRYANPTRTENQIQFHFHDQILHLNREDWEEFELIWNWFWSEHNPGGYYPPPFSAE